MKIKENIKLVIFKMTATVLGVLIISNLAVLGVRAAFPSNDFRPGYIIGDGVALRSSPSTSSTRLELMYNKNYIKINADYNNINGWSHIQRESTKTMGYTNSSYIHDGL